MNSVCMATYNGGRYIKEQLQSILAQIQEDDEVVISDDGSTDDTVAVAESLHDPRIRIIHNGTHYFRDNFENALRHARGEIIFLSDQDDVWLAGKYERCLAELETADLVCTNAKETDARLNIINPDFFSVYHSGRGVIKNSLNNTYYGACMAFHKSLLDRALPFPPTRETGHDIWLGLVAEMTGKVRFIRTPYLLYRRHEKSVTSTRSLLTRSRRPLWKKLWSRIVVLYYVGKFKLRYGKQKSKYHHAPV